jgi:hypothetical protein
MDLLDRMTLNARAISAILTYGLIDGLGAHSGNPDEIRSRIDTENCEYDTARAETIDEAEAVRRAGYEPHNTFTENSKTIKLYSQMKSIDMLFPQRTRYQV